MSATERRPEPSPEEALELVELTEAAVTARSLEQFARGVLARVTRLARSSAVLLYAVDSRLPAPCFFEDGFPPEVLGQVQKLCAEQFERISSEAHFQPVSLSASGPENVIANFTVYPLLDAETLVGLIGLGPQGKATGSTPDLWARLLRIFAAAISRLAAEATSEKQLAHLNSYLTVSSMLVQSLGLHDILETALYCSIDVADAEAASVLLLDDQKTNFHFYQVEGPARPILMGATFPSDRGLAGAVLQTQQSEIINDVQSDPRFYRQIDSQSGFETRNMIAIPLTAGEEPMGVLEVLNKTDGGSFTEDERLLLLSVAEEIAFAVRNARLFEYVADGYCKQRQGQTSCTGCERPLGSWTPCVKYRQASA